MDLRQSHRPLQLPLHELSMNQKPPDGAQRFKINYAELVGSQLIGFGRFGRVHQHECSGITVAVKDIAFTDKEKPSLERLLREGEIHKKLRNRNIITLFNVQLLHQHLLLVMEFAAGGSLSDVLCKHFRLLESSVVTDWASQIAEGMSYLHDKNIVHRDLKPSNILVLESIDNSSLFGKTIKIADFGLACDGHDETRTMSKACGTDYFMAPEVLQSPHRFSKASDVYSFGVIVRSLLTGNESSKDKANGVQVENNIRILPFYEELLKKCCTTEHWKRPTFRNIVEDITQYRGQNAVESARIALYNEEFSDVSSNLLASSSPPASRLQQQQSFSFGAASANFKLPVNCLDVALTQDGRSLLLAAWQQGLIELSSTSGLELSRWWPRKHSSSSDRDDKVLTVASLSDGRAAVSLHFAQLVVLLRRHEKSRGGRSAGEAAAAVAAADAGYDLWTEDVSLQLQWSAHCLSTHLDMLAASESWPGQRLQLLNLSSGRRMNGSELQHGYVIGSLAIASNVLVTGSRDKVKLLGGQREAQVLDAHCLDADGVNEKRLWRHVISSSNQQQHQQLSGVCADTSSGCLYAAVCRSDNSNGRVSSLSLADGTELQRVVLGFHSGALPQLLLLPRQLSLCYDGAAEQQQGRSIGNGGRVLLLAVLCWDSVTKKQLTVMMHRSI